MVLAGEKLAVGEPVPSSLMTCSCLDLTFFLCMLMLCVCITSRCMYMFLCLGRRTCVHTCGGYRSTSGIFRKLLAALLSETGFFLGTQDSTSLAREASQRMPRIYLLPPFQCWDENSE